MKNNSKKQLANELAQTLINFKRFGIQKDHGLEIRQSEFMMLSVIVYSTEKDSKGVKITELGAKSQVTPAAVTHIIDTLVEKKYVERFDDPADRRVVLIKPTEKGKELMDSMKIRLINRCEEIVGFLGEDDSREFVRITAKLCSYFSKKEN